MQVTLTGFAALAILAFGVASALLMLFMALVQPIWSVIDCAVDDRRGALGKVLWIVALILLWGVANWFYGAFAAANRVLLRLTRLAWVFAISLLVAFVVFFNMSAEFRRGVEKEWRNYGGGLVVLRKTVHRFDRGFVATSSAQRRSLTSRLPALRIGIA